MAETTHTLKPMTSGPVIMDFLAPQLLRVALYARVSKDRGQEVENQLVQMREFCKRMGWHIVAEYVDKETGSTAEREQFQKLFADAAQRKFDVVVFWALNRFSREGVLPTLKHLEKLSHYGVGFRSFTEQYLDSAGLFKDAIIAIIATLAKQERIQISERTKAGLERVRASGVVLGRPKHGADTALITQRRKQGASLRTIAREVGVSAASVQRALSKAVPKT